MNRAVVVGVDGTPAGLGALDVAVDEAVRRRCTLRIAHAQDVPSRPADDPWAVVVDAADRAHRRSPGLRTERCYAGEPAGPYLSRLSASAGLVVVGSRGLTGLTGLLAGSVSAYVAAHARCPVLIVPVDSDVRQAPESPGTIVVGLDPRHLAAETVEFALGEAALRDVHVHVVLATPELTPAERSQVTKLLTECERAHPAVPLSVEEVDLPVDEALVSASEEAGLLVLGARARDAGLGAVGRNAIDHSFCPVVMIPALV
jgi:nucleotide-binding universal stress UspA family protein